MDDFRLDLTAFQSVYASGKTPASLLNLVCDRIEDTGLNPVWITLVSREDILARASEVEQSGRANLPLYGVPFAVKDNIDVAGMTTTAGCPAFGYVAEATATVVTKLEDAGAVLIGKTNMDQFATGLVGTRSPYGACSSVFNDAYISGGSSSGSAVAVARGLVSFALGTDTAGSGRVPAAFNNLIGLKPTRGALSAHGVVPACRTLDCVSIFALTSSDAATIFEAARGFDPLDAFSRASSPTDGPAPWLNGSFRFGVPKPSQLEFFGDAEAARLYQESVRAMESIGGTAVEFDFQPFRETADLLYSGPWVAERLTAIKPFFAEHQDEMNPVVREIIGGGAKHGAVETFAAYYRLEELRRKAGGVWDEIDLMLLPTTGTTYTHEQIANDPVLLNTNLGFYTNFVNLSDLAAVAVPAGFRANGLPFGVSLIGTAHTDRALLVLADRLHRQTSGALGGTSTQIHETTPLPSPTIPPGCTMIAVVGAHLTGQPLNRQLTSRGARLVLTTKTPPGYRLFALANTTPPKPGLVREPGFDGPGIELEVWSIPTSQFGSFVAEVPAPLGIGSVELADGSVVKGFVCEPFAVADATEITHFGGWRAYIKSKS